MAARRLKVFQAQFGFYDTVVAAPSQVAALRAWGIHQNLFATGQARITDDPQAVAAALEHPETPLKRAVGSTDPFALEATGLPRIPDPPKRPAVKTVAKAKAKATPSAQPPPDRRELDAAEAALRKLDDQRKREEADFRRRQEELNAAQSAAQVAYVAGRKRATAAVVAARQAYRRAGGADKD